MKTIDLETWKRREHFHFFRQFDYPQFNVCCNLDITRFLEQRKQQQLPFFPTLLHLVMKAVNNMESFKYRIRKGQVVVHDTVHPAFTHLYEEELFGFCATSYHADFDQFLHNVQAAMTKPPGGPYLEVEERDDQIYITSLPWISFTGITHPISLSRDDSVPRVSWGKYFLDQHRYLLPFSVQVHHSLMDGAQVGKYTQLLQEMLDEF